MFVLHSPYGFNTEQCRQGAGTYGNTLPICATLQQVSPVSRSPDTWINILDNDHFLYTLIFQLHLR